MNVRNSVFTALAAVLVVSSAFGVLSTRDIDKVRQKNVLDNKDLRIIDTFISNAVWELVDAADFTSIAKIRTVILARESSESESSAEQYSEQFSESAYKHILEGMKETEGFRSRDRGVKVMLNLLILVDGLGDPRLAELALRKLRSKNTAICYWAIHSVSNSRFLKRLNSGGEDNVKLAKRIVKQLSSVLKESGPESVLLIAEFAAGLDLPEAEQLLEEIADLRISRYADWTVDYELLDVRILKLLSDKITSGGYTHPGFARRFAQLYSYAIQRYINGQNILGDTQKKHLASVLVETEKSCISKLAGVPQSVILKAVERDNVTTLLLEHNRLLGDATKAGGLLSKLDFDYGKTDSGQKRTAPLVLPEPSKAGLSN